MADPRFDWLRAYDYQARVSSLKAGETGLFRCNPAHCARLNTLTRTWANANPDKVNPAGIDSIMRTRRGLLVIAGGAPYGYLDREPDHTWMPCIATYLPD